MIKVSLLASISAIAIGLQSPYAASACTDFLVKSDDGSAIVGRSMEWGLDLKSKVWLCPRGESRLSTTPDGKAGLKWTSKYGYLGLDCHDMPLVLDGMNEKGLSMGLLWLPGTEYQEITPAQAGSAVSILDLGHWMLGSFSTVDEVKAAIGGVRVWAPPLADWGGNPTAHIAIHDAAGNSAVIEFIDGQQKVYDNRIHVLTNAPTFEWHKINLRNYIKISPDSTQPMTVVGTVLAPPGQGGGFLGIPGDWTPPSRFIRTTAMLSFAKPAKGAKDGVNLANHILNAVDIPLGDIREKPGDFNHSDYTQWIVIKDLTNHAFYFRSYDNTTLRAIDMNKLNFAAGEKSHILTPVSVGNGSLDITSQVLGAK